MSVPFTLAQGWEERCNLIPEVRDMLVRNDPRTKGSSLRYGPVLEP
jgi:hypothetical protein